jgi:hypothetical protein
MHGYIKRMIVSQEELFKRVQDVGHPNPTSLSDKQLIELLWRNGKLRPHEVTGLDTADLDGQ